MKRSRLTALTVVAVLTLGACSSGSDDAASTTTEDLSRRPGATGDVTTTPVLTDTPTTTDPAPKTSPDVTEPTDPSTTADETTTTDAAATTPPAPVDESPAGQVSAAIEFLEEQWRTCVSTVPSCDLDAVAIRRQVDEANLAVGEAVRFNNNNYRTANFDRLDYRVDDVAIADDGATAQATVCVTDPIAITEADGTIVDDRFLTSTQLWDMTLVDGEWSLTDRTVVGELVEGEEASVCT